LDILFSKGVRNVSIAPGAFALPIGIGLLRQREVCRRLAMWCVWAAFVFMLIMIGWLFGKAFGLFGHRDVVMKILGQPMNSGLGALLTFLLFGGQVVLLPWMYLVLMRRGAWTAFAAGGKQSRPWIEWSVVVVILLIMAGALRLPLENRLRTGVYFT